MAQTHALSGQVIDLRPPAGPGGDGVSTALLKSAQLELIRLVLPRGKAMREHQVPGEITVQCIDGLIEFSAGGASQRLGPGQLVHLAGGQPHALLALDDAVALLTICLQPA